MSRATSQRGRIRVVLVRPWHDVRSGGGCCGGDPQGPLTSERPPDAPVEHDAVTRVTAATYLLLRERFPDADVQLVSAGNTAYLLPATYAAARRRQGRLAALRACLRAPTAGAVLIDGERVGDVWDLGADGVARLVESRSRPQPG